MFCKYVHSKIMKNKNYCRLEFAIDRPRISDYKANRIYVAIV